MNFDEGGCDLNHEETASLVDAVESLKACVVSRSTGGAGDGYRELRDQLKGLPHIWSQLPQAIRTCRDESELWGFIKPKFGSYQERRDYWRDEFNPVLDYLESLDRSPTNTVVSAELKRLGYDAILADWNKALDRTATDADGALTTARSMIEATCKHILDEAGIQYEQSADLPALYKATAKSMNLAPEQHTEDMFKRVLGGCTSVVEGLGAIRSKLGDAHGKGKKQAKPLRIHSDLAVNLAGAMCVFLLQTWELRKTRQAQIPIPPSKNLHQGDE